MKGTRKRVIPRKSKSKPSRKRKKSTSNKRRIKRTVKMSIHGGVESTAKRPRLSLNISNINKGYDDYKVDDKTLAQTIFLKSKNLHNAADIESIRQTITPAADPDNIIRLFGKEVIDDNKHVSARQMNNGIHEFNTRVFLHTDSPDTQLIKLYQYEDDTLDVVFAYEAFIQNLAERVAATECDVQIPKIYQSGKYIIQDSHTGVKQHFFYIVMEKIEFDSLRDYLIKHANQLYNCDIIADKINQANDCLNDHGVRHGDLNIGNIFIKPSRNDEPLSIALIDFGQAGPSTPASPLDHDYSCDKLNRISTRLQTSASASPSSAGSRKSR